MKARPEQVGARKPFRFCERQRHERLLCSNQRGWSSKRSITPVVRPQMAALGQAALSVDSPDHSAAQVLAFMHGPEAESTENSAVATAKPKGAGGGTTTREDMPLATLQDNNERDSVVKIVWTAEEDQQLLQVRPEYSLPLWNGSIAPCHIHIGTAYGTCLHATNASAHCPFGGSWCTSSARAAGRRLPRSFPVGWASSAENGGTTTCILASRRSRGLRTRTR